MLAEWWGPPFIIHDTVSSKLDPNHKFQVASRAHMSRSLSVWTMNQKHLWMNKNGPSPTLSLLYIPPCWICTAQHSCCPHYQRRKQAAWSQPLCLFGDCCRTLLVYTQSQAVTSIKDNSWVYGSHDTTAARLSNGPRVVFNCYLVKTQASICPKQIPANINLSFLFPPAIICCFANKMVVLYTSSNVFHMNIYTYLH